uniref:Uncharacterized protein n=1 Tax=Canis lupus dingo TaxID=286419 RepID=A0A8C0LF35_CANLU
GLFFVLMSVSAIYSSSRVLTDTVITWAFHVTSRSCGSKAGKLDCLLKLYLEVKG